jgi:phosphate transport system substrate-binding protein
MSLPRSAVLVASVLAIGMPACENTHHGQPPVVRIVGSDTMVNLLQAWAEHYGELRPSIMVQVTGGGSGVGIAALVDGTADVAAASRAMRPSERNHLEGRDGAAPREIAVALDAVAVYVHPRNPLTSIGLDALAEIFAEDGRGRRWQDLGIEHSACATGEIIRIGRQSNSGTASYFRDIVLGPAREYRLGSLDQVGSKDVVALVSRTPCAIGYSGAAFATPDVRVLALSAGSAADAVRPDEREIRMERYPLARPLYLYTRAHTPPEIERFIEWVLGPDGQQVVRVLGEVPITAW